MIRLIHDYLLLSFLRYLPILGSPLLFVVLLLWSPFLSSQKSLHYGRTAYELAQQGNYEAAIIQYEKAIKQLPKNHKYHYHKGVCHFELDQFEAAIQAYSQAIEIKARAEYFYLRAKSYMRLEAFDQAAQDFDVAIRKYGSQPYFFHERGLCKMELGDAIGALSDFNRAIRLEPRIGDYYRSRGMCFIYLERKTEACEDLHKAKELHSFNAKYLVAEHCGEAP